MWNAFSSNKVSCRLAGKLGGIVSERKNLRVDAMRVAGVKTDSLSDEEIRKKITYEIFGRVLLEREMKIDCYRYLERQLWKKN